MIATMTKLPSESFWPTGAIDSDVRLLTSDPTSSVISPLTLPRGATSGYFDQVSSASQMPSRTTRGSRVYSPLSPGARGPALPQLPQFISPHLVPVGRDATQQHRSTSLPPTYRDTVSGPTRPRNNTGSTPRSVAALGLMQGPGANGTVANAGGPWSNGTMPSVTSITGHPRTASVDSNGAPSQTQTIRRLIQQNSRIREAWEAERKYMEANRERAEEVYKEERALMEEERFEWEAEKESLLQEIERLQQHISALGGHGGRARDGSKNHTVPQTLRGGGAWEASPESMRSSMSSQENGQRNAPAIRNAVSLPQLQSSGLSSRALLGLDPLQQFRAGPSELAVVHETEAGPVPVVDVQEIHPELEGIPIKANTIQKPTFTDSPSPNGSGGSSRTHSPPSGSNRPRVTSQGSKEQTLQVLAAEESARLTMHAGHTPSHSLSQLPTVSSSGAHTACSSGDSTPTMPQADGGTSHGLATVTEEESQLQPAGSLALAAANPELLSEYHNDPEPVFEPTEDRPLKGPLMVRNMPAHDDIFFRRLSDKLEEVSKCHQAALPAVLKDVDQEKEPSDHPQPEMQPETRSTTNLEVPTEARQDGSSSAGSDSGTEKDRSSPKSRGEAELDIPLKFKTSMNFGAPFGTFR